MSRSTIGAATAAVLVLSLTACTGGGDGAGDTLDPAASPLATYTEALYGGYDQESANAEQLLIEEQVAACMADEGFEYIPVDQSQNSGSFSGDEWKPDDEEWVAQYGWGFVNSPGQEEMSEEPEVIFVDPNEGYVTALSPSEQTAYYETLYGAGPSEEDLAGDGEYEYNWEEAGCYGAAQQEVQGSDPFSDDKNTALLESMNALYENVQNDSRIVEVNAQWASCMADAGFASFATPQAAQEKFIEELNAFYETSTEGITPDDPKLEELGAREIEVALADLACAVEADSRQLALKVQFELEEQFITDNKSELDALLAEAEQGN